MYGIATLFSLAVLNFVTSLILQLTINVAKALWAAGVINAIIGESAEGFTNVAMQQGGVGLLMTALLISTPPMAASLFNATIGGFSPYAQVNGGGSASSAQPGPQGQPPGTYASGGGYTPQPAPPPASAPNVPPNVFQRPQGSTPKPETIPVRDRSE
jgi:type IV secretion system protein VirB6